MKISMMNIVQHRELPPDFTENFHSIWVDPPWKQVASAEQYERFYRWSLEEIVFAAEKGFDAVGLNEHHQNAFGGVPNPNVFAARLRTRPRRTRSRSCRSGRRSPPCTADAAWRRSTRCSTSFPVVA